MEVRVDPPAESRQMYHEAFRIERDFFYDGGFHGLDLMAAEKKYEPFVAGVGSRADLNYIFQEAMGNLTVGHLFVSGGERPEVEPVPVGLLGADYRIENGRYRVSRVYDGENWNPQLRAPLDAARRKRCGGRVPARCQRSRRNRQQQRLQLLRNDRK